MSTRPSRSRASTRHAAGFTLLEVILALAVLAVSLAIIGEANNIADGNARRAAAESDATIVAESVVAELVAGTVEPIAVEQAPWADPSGETRWNYSVVFLPVNVEGLLALRVRVEEAEPQGRQQAGVEIDRWIVDPDWLATQQAAAASLAGEAAL